MNTFLLNRVPHLDLVTDGAIVIDAQRVVQYFGPHAQQLFEYAEADVVGQVVDMLLHPDDRAAHADRVAGFLGGAGSEQRELGGDDLQLRGYTSSGETLTLGISVIRFAGFGLAAVTRQPETGTRTLARESRAELDILGLLSKGAPAPLQPLAVYTARNVGKMAAGAALGYPYYDVPVGFLPPNGCTLSAVTGSHKFNYRKGDLEFELRVDDEPIETWVYAGPENFTVQFDEQIVVPAGSEIMVHVTPNNFAPATAELTVTLFGHLAALDMGL